MTDVLQAKLDRMANHWNLRNTITEKCGRVLKGKLDVLYFVSEIYGEHDLGKNIKVNDTALCQEVYTCPKQIFVLNYWNWLAA